MGSAFLKTELSAKVAALVMGLAVLGCKTIFTKQSSHLSSASLAPSDDENWLESSSFEPLFTHPSCTAKTFVSYRPRYNGQLTVVEGVKVFKERDNIGMIQSSEKGVPAIDLTWRKEIAADVHCLADDESASTQPAAGQPIVGQLVDMVTKTKTHDDIYVASVELTEEKFADSLCQAATRGVNVAVFLSGEKTPEQEKTIATWSSSCPQLALVDATNGDRAYNLRYLLIVNNNDTHAPAEHDLATLVVHSANLTSKSWGQWDDWQVIRQKKNHWLIQDHLCLATALKTPLGASWDSLYQSVATCRSEHGVDVARITSPVRSYFLPFSSGDYNDRKSFTEGIAEEIGKAAKVQLAAHHLNNRILLAELLAKKAAEPAFEIQIILDAEVYWSGTTVSQATMIGEKAYYAHDDWNDLCRRGISPDVEPKQCSLFSPTEYFDFVLPLVKAGAKLRYLETNFVQQYYFHNKYLVVTYAEAENGVNGSIITGGGSFLSAGFTKNLENYYVTRLSRIHDLVATEFDRVWRLARPEGELTQTWDVNVQPSKK